MTVEEIKERYPFLYDTHLHTSNASACAHSTGAEMARALKEAGYAGSFITDHNWGGNTCVDRSLPWKEWVDLYYSGYREAKKVGDELGIQIFPGMEAGYGGPEFLLYGIPPGWVSELEEMNTASVAELHKLIRDCGGMMIQAHPFREEWYIKEVLVYPDDVDGCEIVNATHSSHKSQSHNNPEFNTKAIALAKEKGFATTGGSDCHTVNLFMGGMAFPTKLESPLDFIKRVMNKEDYVITDGDHWYSRTGDMLV